MSSGSRTQLGKTEKPQSHASLIKNTSLIAQDLRILDKTSSPQGDWLPAQGGKAGASTAPPLITWNRGGWARVAIRVAVFEKLPSSSAAAEALGSSPLRPPPPRASVRTSCRRWVQTSRVQHRAVTSPSLSFHVSKTSRIKTDPPRSQGDDGRK